MVQRIAIVGTGLIGASIGLAAKQAGIERVTGFDPDRAALRIANERGAIDEAYGSLPDAVTGAQIAVVATPVSVLSAQIEITLDASQVDCTVTDVGSTKGAVCGSVSDRTRFIGGHPVSGSEAHGPAHATAELFQGASWFLTTVTETDPDRYRNLHGFVVSLGAVPVAVSPESHDRIVALTSHLPHALANMLLNQTGSSRIDGYEALSAAGGSLRDMTRVAGANPRLWVDIFMDNAVEVRMALEEHRRRVLALEHALKTRDAGYLERWIGEAAENRRRFVQDAYPDAGRIQRLTVHVSDQPGVFAGITQALAAEKINIEDFEVHHLSPERGGTLDVLVSGERNAKRAALLLKEHGYSVTVSPAFEKDT